jgi:hypothetical protein
MLKYKSATLRAWFATNTHVCLHELTTRFGLAIAAAAGVLPNFARFDVRIAYLAAAAGIVLVLIKPSADPHAGE